MLSVQFNRGLRVFDENIIKNNNLDLIDTPQEPGDVNIFGRKSVKY